MDLNIQAIATSVSGKHRRLTPEGRGGFTACDERGASRPQAGKTSYLNSDLIVGPLS